MRRAWVRCQVAILFGVAAVVGCSVDESVRPVPAEPGPVLPDAGQLDSGPAEDAGGVRRTVQQKNPFGNVAETENLFWDGDFEWASPFSDQYGWLKGLPLAYAFDGIRIGAACRSGIKCAALEKGKVLVAIGVASKGHKLAASFWARPEQAACDGITAILMAGILGGPGGDVDIPLSPDAAEPDDAGWCSYRTVSEERLTKPYLYIKNNTGGEILVDDAVLKRAAPTMPLSAKIVLSAAAAADLQAIRADLAKLRGPHDPPPNAARRALSTWRKHETP
jgi:hypothetical protein